MGRCSIFALTTLIIYAAYLFVLFKILHHISHFEILYTILEFPSDIGIWKKGEKKQQRRFNENSLSFTQLSLLKTCKFGYISDLNNIKTMLRHWSSNQHNKLNGCSPKDINFTNEKNWMICFHRILVSRR